MIESKKVGLSGNAIKFIALIAMIIDHLAFSLAYGTTIIDPNSILYIFLKMPGRIVAPVMCYFIAEGYFMTSNKKKYLQRLILLAIVSHFPYILLFQATWWKTTSIIWGFIWGFVALHVVKGTKLNLLLKITLVVVCSAMSLVSTYDTQVVLWILMFGVFYKDLNKQIVAFVLIAMFGGLTSVAFRFANSGINAWYTLAILATIPLLMYYNGERGVNSRLAKCSFYVLFPLHHMILYLFFVL